MMPSSNLVLWDKLEGWDEAEVEGGSGQGIRPLLNLIHVDGRKKPTQYYKVITFQLNKFKNIKKKKPGPKSSS